MLSQRPEKNIDQTNINFNLINHLLPFANVIIVTFVTIIVPIIIYDYQGGVVMSSQITHSQSSNMHHLAHLLDTCPSIFSSCAIFTVYHNRLPLLSR